MFHARPDITPSRLRYTRPFDAYITMLVDRVRRDRGTPPIVTDGRGFWATLPTAHRRALVAVVVGAAALRAAWVLVAARPPQGVHDPTLYLVYAGQIAAGNGYTLPNGEPTASYPIGYPGTLAGALWLANHTPLAAEPHLAAAWLNVLLGTATVVLVFELARRLSDTTAGLAAAALVALWPNLVFHTALVLGETLFNALVATLLLVLACHPWGRAGPGRWRLVAFGVLLGAAILVRPHALVLVPALALALVASRISWHRALLAAGLPLGVAAIVVAPWLFRNLAVMKSPVLFLKLGDDICIGHHPGAPGHFVLPDYCFAGYDHLRRPDFEVIRDREALRKGIHFALSHPGEELRLLPKKVWWTFYQDHDALWVVESFGTDPWLPSRARHLLEAVADGWFFAVGAIGVAGLWAFGPRRDPRRLWLALGAAGFCALPLMVVGDPRYKVPAMPFLAISAGLALVATARRLRRKALSGQPLRMLILRVLTLGGKQNFLGNPVIRALLTMTPKRYRRRVALHLLSISPHYFIYQHDDRYPRSMPTEAILQAEWQRNVDSRRQIFESLIRPHIAPDMTVLDFGSGPGIMANMVASFVRQVIAIDVSSGVIACAKSLSYRDNITFMKTNGEDLSSVDSNSVDLIYSIAVMQHLTDTQTSEYFDEFLRILKPGGKVLCHFVLANDTSGDDDWRASRGLAAQAPNLVSLRMRLRSTNQVIDMVRAAGFKNPRLVRIHELARIEDDVGNEHLAILEAV